MCWSIFAGYIGATVSCAARDRFAPLLFCHLYHYGLPVPLPHFGAHNYVYDCVRAGRLHLSSLPHDCLRFCFLPVFCFQLVLVAVLSSIQFALLAVLVLSPLLLAA